MKIYVRLGISETQRSMKIDLEESGVSKEEWAEMSEDEQQVWLQDYANDLPEQPYWCVETFDTLA
jgi:hypothetical protein